MSYCGTILVKYLSQVQFSQLGMSSEGELYNFISGTLIPQASKFVDSYVQRSFGTPTAGTFKFDGNGKDILFLPISHTPFLGVSAGSIGVNSLNTSKLKVSEQYLVLDGSIWTKGKQNVVLAGSYGYAAVPSDIQLITAQICANVLTDMVRRRVYPDVFMAMAQSGGDAQVLMSSSNILTKGIKEGLEPYKIMWVDIG